MNTVSLNPKTCKTSDSHRLILNLSNQINLKRSDKYDALSNFMYTIH